MIKTTEIKTMVSIIMPCYNSEKYLVDAINSVINQTYSNWELLVIDDCSVDNSVNIIQDFISKDERIRLIRNEKNKGVSETRNIGISLAKGEWIAFLDSDDIWKNLKLEKQILLAINSKMDFIFTGASYINEQGIAYKGTFEIPEEVTYKLLRKQNVISCSSVLVKKKYFENIKMEKDDMHEDYAVWLRILKTGVIASGINEPLLVYRISKTSKSGNKLKTVKMTYKVFRFIGINSIGAMYFTVRHIIGAFKKYSRIQSL